MSEVSTVCRCIEMSSRSGISHLMSFMWVRTRQQHLRSTTRSEEWTYIHLHTQQPCLKTETVLSNQSWSLYCPRCVYCMTWHDWISLISSTQFGISSCNWQIPSERSTQEMIGIIYRNRSSKFSFGPPIDCQKKLSTPMGTLLFARADSTIKGPNVNCIENSQLITVLWSRCIPYER